MYCTIDADHNLGVIVAFRAHVLSPLTSEHTRVKEARANFQVQGRQVGEQIEQHEAGWAPGRVRRHLQGLLRLAWPAMLSRVGIITLSLADTIMVGRFATRELAYLNIGHGTLIAVIIVVSVGLLMGTLVFTAAAHGRGDVAECGRIWRRSMQFGAICGLVALPLALPGEAALGLLGHAPDIAEGGGRVMSILAFGLPAQLLLIANMFFLEGIERPKPGLVVMILGNLLNIFLNYILVYGKFGLPAMGAEGSAWATTIVRWSMFVMLLAYILRAAPLRKYNMRWPSFSDWRAGRELRRMGYAVAISLGAEVLAFASLTHFAGLMGELSLASFGIIMNLLSLPFMFAVGIGLATSVRVGIARAGGDRTDMALAGWTGAGLSTFLLGLAGIGLAFFSTPIVSIYTTDVGLAEITAPLVVLLAVILVFDGGQAVVSSAMRGLGEAWRTTSVQNIAYLGFLVPLGWWLGLSQGRGVQGLVEAIIIASIVSVTMLGLLFHYYVPRAEVGGKNI